MSKLRIIKDRRQERHEEQDLRGFADQKSLSDAHPITHLSISADRPDILNSVTSYLDTNNIMDVHIEKSESIVHLNLSSYQNLSIKEQSVSLFVLSLIISKAFPDVSQVIWVSDKFKYYYANEVKGSPNVEYSAIKTYDQSQIIENGSLKLNGYVTSYLQQSGFNIQQSTLNKNDMNDIRKEELHNLESTSNTKLSKVG